MKSKSFECKICGSKINTYDYYMTSNKTEIFCCNDCCQDYYYKTGEEDYIHISTCGGYYDCKKLNNIYDRCKTVNELNLSPINLYSSDLIPNRCPPAEISIIRTNVRIYDFIKQKEKESLKLNEKTLKVSKSNVKLAWAMLILTAVNVFAVVVQIYLQVFLGH